MELSSQVLGEKMKLTYLYPTHGEILCIIASTKRSFFDFDAFYLFTQDRLPP